MSPALLLGLKVEIRKTPKRGRLVADIYWLGVRTVKVFVKDGAVVARLYGNKSQNVAIPLVHLRSAIGLAESRLQDIEHGQ